MNMRHRTAVIAAVAGLALTGIGAATPAFAAAAGTTVNAGATTGAKAFSIDGTVSALNALKGLVTVKSDSGASSTVSVAPSAAVSVDGLSAKLAKLPIGAQVTLSGTSTNGVNVATSVKATSSRPFATAGTVAAVDGGDQTEARTISVKRVSLTGAGATDVIPVADKALITLDGRKAELSALPVKAHIVVTGTVTGGIYSARTLTALSRWSLNLTGTVSAVDAANGLLTVKTGTPATSVDLTVDPKASITLNGSKVALSGLPVGATVGLTGSETTAGATVTGITAKLGATSTR
jgi:hypothetical protein